MPAQNTITCTTRAATARHSFIYLASASPRRSQLLDQLGVEHRPLLADDSENIEALEAERPGEPPQDYVLRVAVAKLYAARRRLRRRNLPWAPILTADTTVVLGRRILGKPASADHAADMLAALSGKTHRVLTAVTVLTGRGHQSATSLSRVRFASLSAADIQRYVASGEPFGKAGAYAVQGRMAGHIETMQGSYTGIMGLPLFETRQLLLHAGVSLP